VHFTCIHSRLQHWHKECVCKLAFNFDHVRCQHTEASPSGRPRDCQRSCAVKVLFFFSVSSFPDLGKTPMNSMLSSRTFEGLKHLKGLPVSGLTSEAWCPSYQHKERNFPFRAVNATNFHGNHGASHGAFILWTACTESRLT
jgi:hypothetical protein